MFAQIQLGGSLRAGSLRPAKVCLMAFALLASLIGVAKAHAQPTLGKGAIREKLGIVRNLDCEVRKGFPVTLFDFQIHSPYRASIPTNALKESKQLHLRLWTLPLKDEKGEPFQPPREIQVMESVSALEGMAIGKKNYVEVAGSVATGAGEYRHVLSVDDGEGRGCVTEWKVKAKAGGALLRSLALQPGEVADPRGMAFGRQLAVDKQGDGLRVAVFLNADSRSWRRVLNDSANMVALSASLRKVAEDRRVREIAVTVFSLEDQKVLFDQGFQPTVNFRGVGRAFRSLKPGEVDFTDLLARNEARFLTQVLRDREDRIETADLMLFLGARSPVTDKLTAADRESIPPRRQDSTAYLVTNPFRWRSPIERDVIGHIVKNLNGRETEIRLPEDLAKAVDAMLMDALQQRETVSRSGSATKGVTEGKTRPGSQR